MITILAKLDITHKDKDKLNKLCQKQSSCKHFVYNRILENRNITRKELETITKPIFQLNIRYIRDAINEAERLIKSCEELEQNPNKVIFGSRKLFEQLQKRHLSKQQLEEKREQFRETRKYQLYSIGESLHGNVNLQIQGNKLKINVGNRKWIYAILISKHKKWEQLLEAKCYTIKIFRENGQYYAHFTIDEIYPQEAINFSNGVIGIDLNASPSNIAYAEVNKEGNYLDSNTIGTPELYDCRREKRDWYIWYYAKQIVNIAISKNKGIVLENLKTGGPNRQLSNFCRAKLSHAIEVTAKRFGVKCIKVNPAYTSIIGCVKYSPIYNLSRHESAAIVIGRRGLGYSENLPKCYEHLKQEYLEKQKENKKSFTSSINRNNVTQKKKEIISKNFIFKYIYEACRIAVLTEQFTNFYSGNYILYRNKLPNWNYLKKQMFLRE